MDIDYTPPKVYDFYLPMFEPEGRVTERVRNGLENVLSAYVRFAKLHANQFDNNPQNYRVERVSVVGSGARSNRIDSDLDLLLEVPSLDERSGNQMKVLLAFLFYSDKQKPEAIDIYVRPGDIYPEREKVEVTGQVEDILRKYNSLLEKKD